MMADMDEMIDFIRSLKRGFDKDIFLCKLNELSDVVDSVGLDNEDFHTLFKLWLNLSIPITKWTSFGACLVPQEMVEERTVDYAFRWLLASCENRGNFSRMAFLLDWLTAAMTTDSVDMQALDSGYEIFYTLLSFEILTAHALKLVYTLTKPCDVTRGRVIELLHFAKNREGKKNMLRQLQVLLGLFKSYRPECVPEDIPSISVHTSFRKLNVNLMARFKRCQAKRNTCSKERRHLLWINPINSMSGKKKADPLVPNMEFCNIGSQQYADKQPQKNYLDFSDPVSLLRYSLQQPMSRPARLRALFCNETGLTLLAVATDEQFAFLSHDLQHLLTTCFLEGSPHSYLEKQDLLLRLAALQRTLLQGIPVVTMFLAQYLPLWNEKDYFGEILQLVDWISGDSPSHVTYIVDSLVKIYHRAQPIEQCAILKALVNMYCNLMFSCNRRRQHLKIAQGHSEAETLPRLAATISDMCSEGLQISPDDLRVLHSVVSAAEAMSLGEWRHSCPLGAAPRLLPLALPLLKHSAVLLEKMAGLMMLYKNVFKRTKSSDKLLKDVYVEQRQTLEAYTADMLNCLYTEEALTERKSGYVFNRLHPQLVSKLSDLVPGADAKFSLRNNLAFVLYTLMPFEAIDQSDVTNKLCFETVVREMFPNLCELLTKAVPELR
ncbi:centromere protein I-like [Hyposmocoma kahamanoa]|uniref:centromere protein I-like n=1 Tax=Hyposmocoma kahamanoa TaxID=1477025 RepID=UPI000E6D83E2|nr:centromere protein I-like [Hyposmocoma kahamanoa]